MMLFSLWVCRLEVDMISAKSSDDLGLLPLLIDDVVVVVVEVSFISHFRLQPLMGTRQERPGMYLG